ncbi:uncharacterized protein LOC108624795 [Ceratina calcarata]|uniref:Uncharacterized protein LOC108624795 n=1 Tax=Ceratina calcarata TaxID=156304 RepID=A0AAJ7IZ54_9HYME|nr:uncharacterized protein LOC108624795 [Ceratina calcarata]
MDISSILEVQVKEKTEVDSKENVTPREQLPSTTNASLPPEDVEYYKLIFGNDVSMVRFKRLHCTACDAHIGSAAANVHNMYEHPVLFTLLCAKCRDFYGDGMFEQGDDATDMFCRWCANGGNLYCCSFCSNTFCSKCISRNFDPLYRKKIEAEEKWKCFVCDPKDLFRARATCWALLQHVQKMNRLIQSCSSLTDEQIHEKLNVDETTCCPRIRKRKRQKYSSNSEDEDVTYTQSQFTSSKRRRRGSRRKHYNGKNYTEKSVDTVEDCYDSPEVLPSLLSCEQTMVECDDSTVNVDGTIVPNVMQPVHQPSFAIQQQSRVNVVPSTNLLANPVNLLSRMNSINQPRPIRPRYISYNATVPMVTIPNKNVKILSKPSCTESQVPSITPNVIEIDSDPEVVPVIDLTQSINLPTKSNSPKDDQVKPVALVSWKEETSVWLDITDQVKSKTLNELLSPYSEHACNILATVHKKFQCLSNTIKRDAHRQPDLKKAEYLIKRFYREIRDAVIQLSNINDRIVREHSKWRMTQTPKECEKKSSNKNSSNDNNDSNVAEWNQLPLEMTCTNESDSDTEGPCKFVNPSELIYTTNILDGLIKIKNTVSRGVGNYAEFVDKSMQIFDVELLDYDKCIAQSSLQKVQSPTYEEQFIRFLQERPTVPSPESTEENSRELPEPDETTSTDLTKEQTKFTSEMLKTREHNISDISVQDEKDLQSMPGTSSSGLTDNVVEVNDDSNKNSASSNEENEQVKIETGEKYLPCSDNTPVSENEKHNLNRTEDISEDDCIIINN